MYFYLSLQAPKCLNWAHHILNSVSGIARNCCVVFILFSMCMTIWLSGMIFYNSLMFVILCTQMFRISHQLPLELIPWTVRMYFYSVIILAKN